MAISRLMHAAYFGQVLQGRDLLPLGLEEHLTGSLIAAGDGFLAIPEAPLKTQQAAFGVRISTEYTRALAAEGVIQADVNANEAAALVARNAIQADVDANETAAATARGVIQADVNQNESDADVSIAAATTDRALIRTQYIAADAVVTTAFEAGDAAVATSLRGGATGTHDTLKKIEDILTALSNTVTAGVDWKAPVATVANMVTLLGSEVANFKVGDVRVIKSEKDAFLYLGSGGEDLTSLNAAFGSKFIRFLDSSEVAVGHATLQTNITTNANALAAEITANNADHTAATTDRAAVRTEFAAADAALSTLIASHEAQLDDSFLSVSASAGCTLSFGSKAPQLKLVPDGAYIKVEVSYKA